MKDNDIEEIEILDLDDDIIYAKKEVVVEKKVLVNDEMGTATLEKKEIQEIKSIASDNKKKKKEKLGKRKYSISEKIFLIVSILFIIGCFIFYGYRTYHYYHVTHDIVKNITLKDKLTSLNNITYQNDGLYEKSGYFYYKGIDVNNYVYYSGRLFRIIDIDNDIRMIEDNTETNIVWGIDTSYDKSNIKKWLDNYLETLKDYDIYLTKNKWCNKEIDANEYECDETIEDYITFYGNAAGTPPPGGRCRGERRGDRRGGRAAYRCHRAAERDAAQDHHQYRGPLCADSRRAAARDTRLQLYRHEDGDAPGDEHDGAGGHDAGGRCDHQGRGHRGRLRYGSEA